MSAPKEEKEWKGNGRKKKGGKKLNRRMGTGQDDKNPRTKRKGTKRVGGNLMVEYKTERKKK